MDSENASSHKYRRTEVKVERIYVGNKTPQELTIELIKKRRETGGLIP